MKWYYLYNGYKSDECGDFDNLAFIIASKARLELEEHNMHNFFIYHNDKLFNIIKASELDPLSISAHNWNKKQKEYSQKFAFSKLNKDFDTAWNWINLVIYSMYSKTEEDIKEIRYMEEKINKLEVDIPDSKDLYDDLENLTPIKEYKLCYDPGRNVTAKVSAIHFLNNSNFSTIRNLTYNLRKIYQLHLSTEERTFVVALDSAMQSIGILPLSHGTESSSDVDTKILFKFLLLVGASQFYLVHNHPTKQKEMSQADFERTMQIEFLADMLNIKFLDHVIVYGPQTQEVCLLSQTHEMMERGLMNVEDYYFKM